MLDKKLGNLIKIPWSNGSSADFLFKIRDIGFGSSFIKEAKNALRVEDKKERLDTSENL